MLVSHCGGATLSISLAVLRFRVVGLTAVALLLVALFALQPFGSPTSRPQPSASAPPQALTEGVAPSKSQPPPLTFPASPSTAAIRTFPKYVERFGLVTEANFDTYFVFVSREELDQLLLDQPDRMLFPFSPRGPFNLGVADLAGGTNATLLIYSGNIAVFAPHDGQYRPLNTRGNASASACRGDLSGTKDSQYQCTSFESFAPNPQVYFDVSFPADFNSQRPIDPDRPGPAIDRRRGDHLFDFLGADPVTDLSSYGWLAPANQLRFHIESVKVLDAGRPGVVEGHPVTFNRVTTGSYLTPSPTDTDRWIIKGSRVAVLRS